MNRLICEACGSNNIIKSNGLFVCESCGCKYTIDEVKDIVMNVNINVQTDDSDKLERYLDLAREAFGDDLYKDAHNYYSKVLEIEPYNLEAVMYRAICIGYEEQNVKNIEYAIDTYFRLKDQMVNSDTNYLAHYALCFTFYLVRDWYDGQFDKILEISDYYDYNIGIFKDFLDVAWATVRLLDRLAEDCLKEDENFIENFGKLYCNACAELCKHRIKWANSNKDASNASFVGFSFDFKQSIIYKYDEMVFRVRCIIPDFRRYDRNKLFANSIDRQEMPKRISWENEKIMLKNVEDCCEADRRIDARISKLKR